MGLGESLLHGVSEQPDAALVHTQVDRVMEALQEKLPDVTTRLVAAREETIHSA